MNTPHYCSTHQSSISIKKRRKRVLLGITGSVAAIKGPELALQLSKELDAHVAILLTHGGENFWFKAEDYNPQKWNEYYEFVANGTAKSNDDDHHTQAVSSLPQDDDPRSIVMFRKFLFLLYLLHDFIVSTLKDVKGPSICNDCICI